MTHNRARTPVVLALAAVTVLAITGCAALPSPRPPSRPGPTPAPACQPTPPPSAAAKPGTAGLLPFTGRQLRAAAALAATFTSYYGATGRAPAAYLARLRPLATRQLYATLAQGAATRPRGPAGTAHVTGVKVRDLATGSLTFTVQATSGGESAVWAVTVVPAARGWLAYDIEPASAGNAGGGQ
jgi:hypothetical protein